MEKQWTLYILQCRDGTLYTGITDDLQRRLVAHSSGKGAKYTRGRGPFLVRYTELCGDHSQALRRELQDFFDDRYYVLSAGCMICEKCACPDEPCRHPDLMFPCVESHGILVTALCETCGMEFFNGNIVTWVSLIFFR